MEDVSDLVDAQQGYLTTIHATSIPGALVHVELVSTILVGIADRHTDIKTKYELVRINRLLHSIMDVLRANAGGIDPLDGFYVCQAQSPWKPNAKIEAAILDLKKRE